MKFSTINLNHFYILIAMLFVANLSFAQNDSIPAVKTDSIPENVKVKKDKKKKDEFKVLVGATFNSMSVSSDQYDSSNGVGYIIGAKYKRGRFFYWELGARYNAAIYPLIIVGEISEDDLKISSIDVPINVGINLLSITSRLVGLRLYLGAVPTFITKVSDNRLEITKDELNSFRMNGQVGVGVDIAFFFLETGLNYGFTDVFNYTSSNPTQVFVNLGFRF